MVHYSERHNCAQCTKPGFRKVISKIFGNPSPSNISVSKSSARLPSSKTKIPVDSPDPGSDNCWEAQSIVGRIQKLSDISGEHYFSARRH